MFMKIAIVGLLHHPIAEPFAGGMESHTWWLAKKLIERGHKVSLFASGDSDSTLGLVPCISTAFATHPQGQTAAGRYACNMAAYKDVIQQLSQSNFDIVHNNALYPFLLSSAADLPAPMLSVLHSPPYEELVTAVRYATARDRLNRLSIVAVSKSLASEWKAITPTAVIYNGIDVDRWPFVPETPPNQALWYGRMVPEKAPHLAILAALKAGYDIQIAGPISNREYFKENVAPLLESDHVHYLGHLSHLEIRQALSRASVFVNTPCWEEPYGVVYAEALASGTPVATFDRGAAREILTERCGITVKQENIDRLAEAISAAAKLSRQDCRQRAESFCNINTMIDGYERQYQQLILRQQSIARWRSLPGKSRMQIPEVAASSVTAKIAI
jgi:glycosyltransferase involved in cell wall biosynthesis